SRLLVAGLFGAGSSLAVSDSRNLTARSRSREAWARGPPKMHRYARRRSAGWWLPPALTLRGYWWAVALVAAAIQLLTMSLVSAGILAPAGAFALASLWLGSILVGITLVSGPTIATKRRVRLAQGLAVPAR